MKNLFFLLLLVFNLSCFAQDSTSIEADSSAIPISIELKSEHHYLIIDFLEDLKSDDAASYVGQVVSKTDSIYNPVKPIRVNVFSRFVPEVYRKLSAQREGVVMQPNQEMKEALFNQLSGFSWIAARIMEIDAQNAAIRTGRALRGFNYARRLKYGTP